MDALATCNAMQPKNWFGSEVDARTVAGQLSFGRVSNPVKFTMIDRANQ
jgi:hypothetical protein